MEATKTKMNNGKGTLIPARGKVLSGVVVSTKMKDTIVVEVTRFVKHPKYGKFYKVSKNFKAHDAGNTAHEGDSVEIVETRPISKDKHFKLSTVVGKKTIEELA